MIDLRIHNLDNTKRYKIITNETAKEYIDNSEVDNCRNTFVGINNKKVYYVKTTPEISMILVASNLMDDYKLFMEEQELTEKITSYLKSSEINSMQRMNF